MFVSRKLKEENIAEYLLYMWQVEDMIRANGMDMERIRETLVTPARLDAEREKELSDWYENLVEMMRLEGVSEKGHLQINKNTVTLLTDLHLQLLKSTKYPFYSAAYYKALPFIVELRTQGNNRNLSELENCFEVLYGVLLLKLQKREISEGTLQAVKAISQFLGILSDYYKKDKAGELELE
ncbi:MAG: DUF4924 family protein [Bacteroidaceae bacterium]|nr:DUF4924 family protein [Bacteroidaceae bacterium]